jgi:hypothetical protein
MNELPPALGPIAHWSGDEDVAARPLSVVLTARLTRLEDPRRTYDLVTYA